MSPSYNTAAARSAQKIAIGRSLCIVSNSLCHTNTHAAALALGADNELARQVGQTIQAGSASNMPAAAPAQSTPASKSLSLLPTSPRHANTYTAAPATPAVATTMADTPALGRGLRKKVASAKKLLTDGNSKAEIAKIVQVGPKPQAQVAGNSIPKPRQKGPTTSGRIAKAKARASGLTIKLRLAPRRDNVKSIKLTYKNQEKDALMEEHDTAVALLGRFRAVEQEVAAEEAKKPKLTAEEHAALVQARQSDWTHQGAIAVTRFVMFGDRAHGFGQPTNGLLSQFLGHEANLVGDAIYTSTRAALREKNEPRHLSTGRYVPVVGYAMQDEYEGGGYEDDVEPADDESLGDIWERRYLESLATKTS